MPPEFWKQVSDFGLPALILGWFMLRQEPRMIALEASLDRLAEAILLILLNSRMAENPVHQAVRDQAEPLLEKVRDSQRRRNPK